MKKFLVAAAASLLIFGGQADVEASSAIDAMDMDLQSVETQETGHWANFRDEVILGRESDRERRKRKEYERRERERWERHERERRERERREWERRHRQPPLPPPPPPGYGTPPPRPGHGTPPPRPGHLPPPPPRMR